MSDLIVEVCAIDSVEAHPNADRLEVCHVKGWRTCAVKGMFKPGERCVFFPPDCILPTELSDRLGITKYLSPVKKDGSVVGGRVRVANMRGYKSFGTIMRSDGEVGDDVAERLGVTKWEPPVRPNDGSAARSHPAFHRYTSIENWRNFPDLIKQGTEVVFTEKIHGCNVRLGLIRNEGVWEFMAGSHNVQRKEFDREGQRSRYWDCFSEEVKNMLVTLCGEKHDVILYGELFGSGVQDICYGLKNGDTSFRAFDVCVDGTYLDFDEFSGWCDSFKVPTVPLLYRGAFSKAVMEKFVDGPTTMCEGKDAGPFKGREGIVIKAVESLPNVRSGRKIFDRLILKCVSFDYHERKNGTEYH